MPSLREGSQRVCMVLEVAKLKLSWGMHAGHVGKTSLLARFIHNTFREDRQATVQAGCMSRTLTVDGTQVCILL